MCQWEDLSESKHNKCVCVRAHACESACMCVALSVLLGAQQYVMQSAHTVSCRHGNQCPLLKAFVLLLEVYLCDTHTQILFLDT